MAQETRASLRANWYLLGPAFVAAIAYVDPGNVAANLTAGASYGYLLVWVLVVANASAVLVQYLSAKLGIVTGRSLPEVLGQRMRRMPRLLFWAQAEIVAAATDVDDVPVRRAQVVDIEVQGADRVRPHVRQEHVARRGQAEQHIAALG